MSKVLYPRPKTPVRKKVAPKKHEDKRPYQVRYSDPSGDLTPEWRGYNSELAVKIGAWFRCRVLGFQPEATLYTREELQADKPSK
jgi:hypothetical protein